MITETHFISKGQFLAQLEPFKSTGLPTDSIIHKEITGCGATTLELEFPRNSIIIEPNLPVILGKARKINGKKRKNKIVLAVYDSVTVEHIKAYVKQRVGYKKILTTPEGFEKIVNALGEIVLKEYFILFDECEKAIQDVDFRDKIIEPLKLFFSCTNKAFISATPIIPSDPRFTKFKRVLIKPNYIYKHSITVCVTNNIVFHLKKIIDSYNEFGKGTNRKFFIFFKSTLRIRNIIQGLNLEDYSVFCSESSVKDVKKQGIVNAFDRLGHNFSNYNFFTSRFFSAVDFDYKDYKCDPIIIMISDPLAIEHTVIDPKTEAIQIIGRFREPELKKGEPEITVQKDIYHISNYRSTLTSFDEEDVNGILNDIRNLHLYISGYKVTSNIAYINAFKEQIIELKQFAFYHRNSEPNYFMFDNFRYTEQVKGYYKTSDGLKEKYKQTEPFVVSKDSGYTPYVLDDQELRENTKFTAESKVNELVSLRVKELMENKTDSSYWDFNMNMLRLTYPKQMALIDKFTLAKAAALDFSIDEIKKHDQHSKVKSDLNPLQIYIKNHYNNQILTSGEIKELLIKGIEETGVKGHQADLSTLKLVAKLSKRVTAKNSIDGKSQKGYKIIEFLSLNTT